MINPYGSSRLQADLLVILSDPELDFSEKILGLLRSKKPNAINMRKRDQKASSKTIKTEQKGTQTY